MKKGIRQPAQLRNGKRSAVMLAAIAGVMMLGETTQAAIIQTNSSDANGWGTGFPVSATDLVNTGQATFSSLDATPAATQYDATSTYALLNNGVGGGGYVDAVSAGTSPITVTFTLDTTFNTLGYDISEINTFASGFGFAGVGWQTYELLYSPVGSADFTSLGTFTFVNNDYYTKISLTSSAGPIASGVDQVRFVLDTSGSAGNGTGWTELDVIGTATAVPEPSAVAMIGLAAVGAFFLVRNARRCES